MGDLPKHPSDNSTSLIIGGEVKSVGLAVAGKLFVFNPKQMQFLLAVQKLKNVHAASLAVGRDEEWGKTFLKSRKFTDYLAAKLEEHSVKNGLTPEYLIRWGQEAMEGKRSWYEGVCPSCQYANTFNNYEFAEGQDDDLKPSLSCKRCFSPTNVEYKESEFKPTREQMEAYKELKSTIIPKVERVHHQFSNEEIVFESSGD